MEVGSSGGWSGSSENKNNESNKGKSRFTDDSDGAGKKGGQTNFLGHREPRANGKHGGGKGFQHGGKKGSAKGSVKGFTSDSSETNTLIPAGSDVDLYNNMGSVVPAVPPTVPPPMFMNEHHHHLQVPQPQHGGVHHQHQQDLLTAAHFPASLDSLYLPHFDASALGFNRFVGYFSSALCWR